MTPGMNSLFLYFLPALMAFVLSFQPAMVGLVVVLNTSLSLVQSVLFGNDWFRKSMNMAPKPPQASPGAPAKGFLDSIREQAQRQAAKNERAKAIRENTLQQSKIRGNRSIDVQSAKAYEKKLGATKARRQQRDKSSSVDERKF
jgi:hypothetical protein